MVRHAASPNQDRPTFWPAGWLRDEAWGDAACTSRRDKRNGVVNLAALAGLRGLRSLACPVVAGAPLSR